MHPHRGFMECPYTKLMTSSDGRSMSTLTKNRVKAGGVEHKLSPEPGTFELGKVSPKASFASGSQNFRDQSFAMRNAADAHEDILP